MAYILLIKGERARKGMEVTDFRGDKFVLTDWKKPGISAGPNGKVYCNNSEGESFEWYPSVIFGKFEEREFPYLKECAGYDSIKHLPGWLLNDFENDIEAYESNRMEDEDKPLSVHWYTGAISTETLLSEYAKDLDAEFKFNLLKIHGEIKILAEEYCVSYDEIIERLRKNLKMKH